MILKYHLRLDVPYDQKDLASSLGARPHFKNIDGEKQFRFWFVPAGMDVKGFAQWWPKDFTQAVLQATLPDVTRNDLSAAQEALKALEPQEAEVHGAEPGGDPARGEGGTRLSDYLGAIKRVVKDQFSTPTWIMADVVNVTGREGSHRYLELAEYDQSGSEIAKGRAMMWSRKASVILPRFQKATGMPLAKGTKVLLKVRAEVSERYGLSLQIEDIDPRFTVGEMQAKMQRIRQRLSDEGRLTQRGRIQPPRIFSRVALIAPDQAAGLGDFNTQADVLRDVGLCHFELFSAYFQGDQAKTSIAKALTAISRQLMDGEHFDAIVMIRGGGDTAGLLALNEYEILAAMCDSQIPILVGIGHERDQTLLDEYAALSFATPSMVVNAISRNWMEHGESVRRTQGAIHQKVGDIIAMARQGLMTQDTLVRRNLQASVDQARDRLAVRRERHDEQLIRAIEQARQELRSAALEVAGVSPNRILEMGYAYVMDQSRATIPSIQHINKESSLTLRMRDGEIPITRLMATPP